MVHLLMSLEKQETNRGGQARATTGYIGRTAGVWTGCVSCSVSLHERASKQPSNQAAQRK